MKDYNFVKKIEGSKLNESCAIHLWYWNVWMVSPDVLLECAFLMTLLLADRTLKHGLFTTFKSNVLQQAASVFVTSTTANTTMPSLKHVAKQSIPLRCNTVTIISLELDKIRVKNTAVFCIEASSTYSQHSHNLYHSCMK